MPRNGPTLVLRFYDNNGKRAEMGFPVPALSDVVEVAQYMNLFASAVAPLSNAVIRDAFYTQPTDILPSPPAEPGSNVYTRGYLLFREGANLGLVSLPSPRQVLFDVDGAYRAIRIQRSTLALLGVLAPLEAALAGCALPDGTAFPSTYSVGGTSELVL